MPTGYAAARFPPKGTVDHCFNPWRKDGTWAALNDRLREPLREELGREAAPSAARIDSQSVKTTAKRGARGYAGGKKVKGRKRHILVDTEGLLLKAFVSEANSYDGTVETWLLPELKKRFPRLKKLWADGTYGGEFVEQARDTDNIAVEITTRLSDQPGFQVIPRWWVVERTFAWFSNYRRLSKDYEYWVYTSDAMLYATSVHLMTRRFAL